MTQRKNLKFLYWYLIFGLLFFPITNSFFVNISKLFKTISSNSNYKTSLSKLEDENKKLDDKVKYVTSEEGLKSLIKDRLDKVEDGEVIIKLNE